MQTDSRNPDDHLFLLSAAQRFGLWFSRPGGGVSHPVHMRYFGRPGATMVGSDSHTGAAGSLGMLATGVGGLDVATAVAGHPLHLRMPEIWGVRLVGELPTWVSAKDVILEMLRRHGVKGGVNRILEYHGPGVSTLSAMDRHVVANMGAELGATTTVFPSDDEVRRFLRGAGREAAFAELVADPAASYDFEDEIDLSSLEPLIACPSSPGNVVPVREVVGEPVHQVVVGSSANPGLRDVAVVAAVAAGRTVHPQVSLDVNPSSREIVTDLANMELLAPLLSAGARLHQAGCLGCIGMGQAPATGRNSLRTFPRNFSGRSGTPDDRVWLCSPETAVAAALTGEITDPRTLPDQLGIDYPELRLPESPARDEWLLVPPLPESEAARVELVRGPNIRPLPEGSPLADRLRLPVLLKVGDDVSTDEIMPAGNRVLPFRSNVAKMADFAFVDLNPCTRRELGKPTSRNTRSSPVTTTGKAALVSTPRSFPTTWAYAWSSRSPSPASTGRTWRTSVSWPSSSQTNPTTVASTSAMSWNSTTSPSRSARAISGSATRRRTNVTDWSTTCRLASSR